MNLEYKTYAIQYKQNEQEYYSLVFPFHVLEKLSQVLIYDINRNGYQRKVEPNHIKKLKKYIDENSQSFLLPSSVILAINENNADKYFQKRDNGVIEFDYNAEAEKVFHIVDGQHRITGIKESLEKHPQLQDFLMPVVVLKISKKNPFVELNVFNDLNSKGKRIKVDLIDLAKYSIQLKSGEALTEGEVINHLCMKTSYLLNESDKYSSEIWHNAIKFDIHADTNYGIVGVHYFNDSIQEIVKFYLEKHKGEQDLEVVANEAADFLTAAWQVIRDRWPSCFHTEAKSMQIEDEMVKYFYNDNFLIQKTLGVKSLNPVAAKYLSTNADLELKIKEFKLFLKESKVKTDDWKRGGTFSGLSSEAGFKKVRDRISER